MLSPKPFHGAALGSSACETHSETQSPDAHAIVVPGGEDTVPRMPSRGAPGFPTPSPQPQGVSCPAQAHNWLGVWHPGQREHEERPH